jgi:translation initiation factor IF-2
MNTESMGTGTPGGTQAKKAIYELAKDLGMPNKDLVNKIQSLGIDAKNHMSRLSEEDVERVRRALAKERQENTVQERVNDTVIRRRSKDGSMLRPQAQNATPPPAATPVAPAAPVIPATPTVVVRPAAPAASPAATPAPTRQAVAAPPAAPVRRITVTPATPAAPTSTGSKAAVEAAPTPSAVVRRAAPPAAVTAEAPVAKAASEKAARPAVAPSAPPAEPTAKVAAEPPAPQAASTRVETRPAAVESAPPPAATKPQPAETAAPASKPAVKAAAAAPVAPAPTPNDPPVLDAKPAPKVEPAAKSEPSEPAVVAAPVAVSKPVVAPPVSEAPAPRAPEADPTPAAHAALAKPVSGSTPSTAESRVFVTAQTRRQNEGLGPTGRVIDLASLRPPAPPAAAKPSAESPRTWRSDDGVGRGPRQEISGERLRALSPKSAPAQKQQKQKPLPGRKPKQTQITTAAEHKRVVKMGEAIVVAEFARQMGAKATDVLKKIWELGVRQVMINSPIDFDTAQLVAAEFEWRVESTAFQEEMVVNETEDKPEDLRPRAPVVTIMGHVDHGKTSLLDAIRNANVAAGEAGGITQHIGAYKVSTKNGDVVFLDTPGHEAFTEMRARGAQVTDIVVLVVAADDGVMPQTLEALNHARDAKVPIIVAVNKIDKPGAQPDRIRQQLSGHGLTPEEWGGETIYCDVSARNKTGVDRLLEMLALQSEILELKANPNKPARGTVVEARMDAKRGPVSTLLVEEGTLRIGDSVVVGEELGKVRAMIDDKGRQIQQAGPSTPAEVLGLSGVPKAGEVMNVVNDERAAKELVEHRRNRRIEKERAKAGPVSLDKLMDAMKAGLKDLKIILKADVQGSVEALASALSKLSTDKVKVTVIQAAVGGITETDVNLAKAGNAIIIGFHVRPAGKAASLAEQEGVDIKLYDIIYDAIDEVKQAMAGLLAPVKRDKTLGKAEVRELFNIPKIGAVLGCFVIDGSIKRSAQARVIRDSVLIYTGKLGSLRRFKDDVREVLQGYECGMTVEGYQDIKSGDIIECFEVEEIAATLD